MLHDMLIFIDGKHFMICLQEMSRSVMIDINIDIGLIYFSENYFNKRLLAIFF